VIIIVIKNRNILALLTSWATALPVNSGVTRKKGEVVGGCFFAVIELKKIDDRLTMKRF